MSRGAGSRPEFFEEFARFGGAAAAHPVGESDGVHRAGAGAADSCDVEPLILEEPVEHPQAKAPCESPPCKASLIDFFGWLFILYLRDPRSSAAPIACGAIISRQTASGKNCDQREAGQESRS